jgi:3-hydroxyisobutyrate dehydrogenase-like beta-hydroxyacid dehydrogenase
MEIAFIGPAIMGSLKWMAKDLNLAALAAFEQGLALPGTAAAKELYALASTHGWGEKDFSGIYGFLGWRRP